MELINEVYYFLRPIIPRRVQILSRRTLVRIQRMHHVDVWPIDEKSVLSGLPRVKWPENKEFAFVLTHDVDTQRGMERCLQLAEVEKSRGLRSSFNFVPERYEVSESVRKDLVSEGFEVGVHGLLHDGKLYESEKKFIQRAEKINWYLNNWGAVGFRSPAMHHNLDWIGYLNVEYDASTFDTDPFEPQSDGVGTVFPFWVESERTQTGYMELPYTLPQDFTLFVLMKNKNTAIWNRKLDWIVKNNGMALLNVHPDYVNFKQGGYAVDEYPVKLYEDFLDYVLEKYGEQFWHALPKEVARYSRNQLTGADNGRGEHDKNFYGRMSNGVVNMISY